MGFEGRRIIVTALLDSHGGAKEIADQELYRTLVSEIQGIVQSERYETLNLQLNGW